LNSRFWLGQIQTCGRVKPVNGISTPPLLIGSPMTIDINKQ